MLDKTVSTLNEAVSEIRDGSTILVGGFGGSGAPIALLTALLEHGARELVIVSNNAGSGPEGLNAMVAAGQVRKLICSYPKSPANSPPLCAAFEQMYRAGKIELECIPQGTMVERMRAAGAGLGPFFSPTGYGTLLAEGKESRVIDGIGYVLEQPIRADYAMVKADLADRWGNLTYRLAGRNFAPVMCTAARCTIVQAREIVPLGTIPPEQVVTPGIFVQKVIQHAD